MTAFLRILVVWGKRGISALQIALVTNPTSQTCRSLCFKGDFSEVVEDEVCEELVPVVAGGPGTSP